MIIGNKDIPQEVTKILKDFKGVDIRLKVDEKEFNRRLEKINIWQRLQREENDMLKVNQEVLYTTPSIIDVNNPLGDYALISPSNNLSVDFLVLRLANTAIEEYPYDLNITSGYKNGRVKAAGEIDRETFLAGSERRNPNEPSIMEHIENDIKLMASKALAVEKGYTDSVKRVIDYQTGIRSNALEKRKGLLKENQLDSYFFVKSFAAFCHPPSNMTDARVIMEKSLRKIPGAKSYLHPVIAKRFDEMVRLPEKIDFPLNVNSISQYTEDSIRTFADILEESNGGIAPPKFDPTSYM